MDQSKTCEYCNGDLVDHRCRKCGLFDAGEWRGKIVGDYRIVAEIGRGSSGVVYHTRQLSLDRPAALKVLANFDCDSDFEEEFFREARLTAVLNHPNIISAIESGKTADGIYFFAMELVKGRNAEELLLRDERMRPGEIYDVAAAVSGALDWAWSEHRLTHGDVKPANLLLAGDGVIKLADFGLARIATGAATRRAATPAYAAPELLAGTDGPVDPVAVDMYAFGITLYELWVGRPPFEGETDEVMEMQKHSPLPEVPEELMREAPELWMLIGELTHKNPAERPKLWSEVNLAVRSLRARRMADGEELGEVMPSGSGPAARRGGARRLLWLLSAAATAAVMTAAAVMTVLRHSSTIAAWWRPDSLEQMLDQEVPHSNEAGDIVVIESPSRSGSTH